jgi:hypothetical protein
MWERQAGRKFTSPGTAYRTKSGEVYLRTEGFYPRDIGLPAELPGLALGEKVRIQGVLQVREHRMTVEDMPALDGSKEGERPLIWRWHFAGDVFKELYLKDARLANAEGK